jgi:hypothetical protein
METPNNKVFYRDQVTQLEGELNRLKKSLQQISFGRLAVFSAAILTVYFFGFNWITAILLLIFLVIFLWLVSKWQDMKDQEFKQSFKHDLNRLELQVLGGNWSGFSSGERYKTENHPYERDLDLVGEGSFFQLINRTVHPDSSDELANALLFGSKQRSLSQCAISSLVKDPKWCQDYLSESKLSMEKGSNNPLSKVVPLMKPPKMFFKGSEWVLTCCSLISLAFYLIDTIDSGLYLLVVAFMFLTVGLNLKRVNTVSGYLSSLEGTVTGYKKRIELISAFDQENNEFGQFVNRLTSNAEEVQSSLTELQSIQKWASFRNNVLVGALLNVFFAWDVRICHRLQKWLKTYQLDWLEKEKQFAHIEVWISGAIFWFNFPSYTFATVHVNDELKVQGLTHPFLSPEKAVKNDLIMEGIDRLLIVTGPNMAGKSTFLRSVGLLFVCAEAGLPVAATTCELPQRKLFTSMRLTDNLNKETSYFFAELLRLKEMMNEMEDGKQLFVIIDEMLKGTNSEDKEQGSIKYLKKINAMKAIGIIATHDLALCSLEHENSGFKNKFFDSVIEGDQLYFDYRLKNGQCQNMNAQFLMRKLGLIDH